eukprot:CAMPEP_0167761106 /NCGR_PEP_ID=MMETSP0110_2-20121227/11975_1 /TAXON_ID=629695 /ORGANISM="Gymnochlora sp., Strain CCMP2014" /LENGTH=140 /DNA_ID=CAMNT_0007647727 /DNA_START=194 /DNA_END=617 /DNA_ORIENTATION=-
MMLSAGFELSERENDLLFDAIAIVVAGIDPPSSSEDSAMSSMDTDSDKASERSRAPSRGSRRKSGINSRNRMEFYTPELKPAPEPSLSGLKMRSSSRDVKSAVFHKPNINEHGSGYTRRRRPYFDDSGEGMRQEPTSPYQ